MDSSSRPLVAIIAWFLSAAFVFWSLADNLNLVTFIGCACMGALLYVINDLIEEVVYRREKNISMWTGTEGIATYLAVVALWLGGWSLFCVMRPADFSPFSSFPQQIPYLTGFLAAGVAYTAALAVLWGYDQFADAED
jgi:hypothetical protein